MALNSYAMSRIVLGAGNTWETVQVQSCLKQYTDLEREHPVINR